MPYKTSIGEFVIEISFSYFITFLQMKIQEVHLLIFKMFLVLEVFHHQALQYRGLTVVGCMRNKVYYNPVYFYAWTVIFQFLVMVYMNFVIFRTFNTFKSRLLISKDSRSRMPSIVRPENLAGVSLFLVFFLASVSLYKIVSHIISHWSISIDT